MNSARTASLWLVFSVAVAFGQSNMGSITGIVTDRSGAAVVDARLRIVNKATSVAFSATSNEAGVYLAPSLLGGVYLVESEAAGFKKAQTEVMLDAGQRLRLDLRLELGDVTETVEVQAAATELNSETAELSKTIDSKQIQGLPLNGRNAYYTMSLVPGVAAPGTDPTQLTYASNASINGSRTRGNAMIIDGVVAQLIDGNSELVGSIEAVQEVKVLTSTYSAEYGRTSGGVVATQIKSGTQNYHGALYEFHRDSAISANSWANNAQGVPQSKLIRNEFGVNGGGPVPKTGKKMFFFFSYEGIRDDNPVNRIRTIPDPSLRTGNFSRSPVVVNDPTTGLPFPGNIIPQNRLDPAAQKFLQLFPTPDAPGTFNSRFGITTSNWLRSSPGSDYRDFYVGRWDWTPNEKQKLFFTYVQQIQGPLIQVSDFTDPINSIQGPRYRVMRRATVSYTRFFTPNLSMEILASAQRDPRKITPSYPDFDVTKELGIAQKVGPNLPTINLAGGYGSYGDSSYQNWVSQPSTLSQSTTYLKGRHTIKFGGQLYQPQFWYIAANQVSGQYTFNGEITGLGLGGTNNPINALADLELGAVKTAGYQLPQIPVNRLGYNLGLYVNDDWKATNKLTINLGLRYDLDLRQIVKNNVYSRVELGTGRLLVAGQNASQNLNRNNDYINFAPRLGLAYAVSPKTIVRSGFAMFYNSAFIDNGTLISYPGFSQAVDFPDLGVGRAQQFRLQDGFPVGAIGAVPNPLALASAASPSRPLPVSSVTYNADDKLPYNVQWNFSIQREVGFKTVMELAYVGSRSVHLSRNIPANNPTLAQATAIVVNRQPLQTLRPYPNYTAFNAVYYDGTSSYNALQIRGTRRFSGGFSFDANYTFSKNIDTASDLNDLATFQIPWQYGSLEKGLSSLDRTNVLNVGWVYELPFGRGKHFLSNNRLISAVIGGFQFNGLFSASSGLPVTITQRITDTVLLNQRPDVINSNDLNGALSSPRFEGRGALRVLAAPGDPQFPFKESSIVGIGNLGRNTARAPGYWNFNLGLFRNFPLTEKIGLQFRVEAYNALNHVNFLPAASYNISDPSYGLITGSAPARQVQIGLRLSF